MWHFFLQRPEIYFPGSMPFPPGGQLGSLISDVLLAAGTWSNKRNKNQKTTNQDRCYFHVNLTESPAWKGNLNELLQADPFQSQTAGEAELKTLDFLQIPTEFKSLRWLRNEKWISKKSEVAQQTSDRNLSKNAPQKSCYLLVQEVYWTTYLARFLETGVVLRSGTS